MSSDTRIPASSASVSQAAPWASTEKSTSAQGETRRATGGCSFMSARILPSSPVSGSAGKVADTNVAPLLPGDRLAGDIPDVRRPRLADEILDCRRQRHVLEIVGHLVAVGVRPVEELQCVG